MLSVQNISSGISAILYLSAVPLVGALTIGAKLAYLVPLLIKWNNPHLASSKSSRRSTCQTKSAQVKRLGIHHVAISDPAVIQSVLGEDVKCVNAVNNGSGTVMARSNIVVRGCSIQAGTLITLYESSGSV